VAPTRAAPPSENVGAAAEFSTAHRLKPARQLDFTAASRKRLGGAAEGSTWCITIFTLARYSYRCQWDISPYPMFTESQFYEVIEVWTVILKKIKPGTYYNTSYMRWTHGQKRCTISEVATDCHELMILQHSRRPSIARVSEHLDSWCEAGGPQRPPI